MIKSMVTDCDFFYAFAWKEFWIGVVSGSIFSVFLLEAIHRACFN